MSEYNYVSKSFTLQVNTDGENSLTPESGQAMSCFPHCFNGKLWFCCQINGSIECHETPWPCPQSEASE